MQRLRNKADVETHTQGERNDNEFEAGGAGRGARCCKYLVYVFVLFIVRHFS